MNHSPKVLVVDDETSILNLVRKYLTASGMSVVYADNGSEALILVRESRPDVILLDAEMPGLDGHSVCRMLKKQVHTRHIPIVMMSGARLDDADLISGFTGGADDYVAKPFSLPVLLARLQAVLRRGQAASEASTKLKLGGIDIDAAGRTVNVDGRPVSTTSKEFDLLSALLSKPGKLLGVAYLLETVWGVDPAVYNDPATVEVHISRLRKKLGPKVGKRIVNMPGHGYKFK